MRLHSHGIIHLINFGFVYMKLSQLLLTPYFLIQIERFRRLKVYNCSDQNSEVNSDTVQCLILFKRLACNKFVYCFDPRMVHYELSSVVENITVVSRFFVSLQCSMLDGAESDDTLVLR